MNQETERKWVVNIFGWPEELVAQAPEDIQLIGKPNNIDHHGFRDLRGFVCWPLEPTDHPGNILMDIGFIKSGSQSTYKQWVIEVDNDEYKCDWDNFKETLAGLEKNGIVLTNLYYLN